MTRVFVLGAGVSSSAGLPLAHELLATVAERTLKPPERAELDEFLEYLMPTFQKDLENYPDVEEFLTLLDVARSHAQFTRTGLAFPRRKLSKLKNTFLRGLAKYLWGAHKTVTDTHDHPIALLARSLKRGDTIITFNYDLTVDWALQAEKRDWNYEPNRHDITLLKPHGSIDWFHADEVDAEREGFSELFTDFTQFDEWVFDAEKLDRILPVIVPPVVTKLIDDPDLQRIWTEVSRSLLKAQHTYILGYSLPEADRLTRFVLRRAVRGRKKSSNIWAINPDGQLRSRFAECISSDVAFVQQRFETWVEGFRETEVRREQLQGR